MSSSRSPQFPLGGEDISAQNKATCTCYCGAVQIAVPTEKPGLVDTFVCNCTDCRKITASMFASNFIVEESATEHIRGQDRLTKFAQNNTIATGNTMANYFCSQCGTLMYRASSGFPGKLIPRIGTIDDFNLQETTFKPRIEQFCKDRVAWLSGAEGAQYEQGNFYKG